MKSQGFCIQMGCCSSWEVLSVCFFTWKGPGMDAVYPNNKSLKHSWKCCQKCWMQYCYPDCCVSAGFSREGKSAGSELTQWCLTLSRTCSQHCPTFTTLPEWHLPSHQPGVILDSASHSSCHLTQLPSQNLPVMILPERRDPGCIPQGPY